VTDTARAIVFTAPGRPLELQTFPIPKLHPGQVLVRISCCTICGSDLHTLAGHRSTPTPTILGHEIIGHVAALPDGDPVCDLGGRPLTLSDRITWSVAANCSQCFFCFAGLPQKCEKLFKYGHQKVTDDHPLSGGMADAVCLAPGTAILRVPDDLPDQVACPANCATATVAAAYRAASDVRDQTVLIHGAGMLGLTAAAMAAHRGAKHIIVVDPDPDRLALAQRFGATHTIRPSSNPDELQNVVNRLTENRGADLALDLSGHPAAMQTGLGCLRTGGTAVWVGAVSPTKPIPLDPERLVRNCLTLRGIHNYAPQDLAAALAFLKAAHDRYPFQDLVTAAFPLDRAEDALRHATETNPIRIALLPNP
jgi:alcohol dehydrogenase